MLQNYNSLQFQDNEICLHFSEQRPNSPHRSPKRRRTCGPNMTGSETNATASTPISSMECGWHTCTMETAFSEPQSEAKLLAVETKPHDTNHEIKATLTNLLNCEAVRNDNKMRLLVQTRLMEAELELRRQRRRRISQQRFVVR